MRTRIGNHLLVAGDCLEFMTAEVPAGVVDAVVTSPPYNLGVDYGHGPAADSLQEADYIAWIGKVLAETFRVLKPDGNLFLNVAGSSTRPMTPYSVLTAVLASGFRLQNNIAWIKAVDDRGHFKPVNSTRFLHRSWEHVFHLTKSGAVGLDRLAAGIQYTDKTNIARRGHVGDRRCRGNTWFVPMPTTQGRGVGEHPAPFPVEVARRCLQLCGQGGMVLDPFAGSGTVALAASELGWCSVGVDISEDYVRGAVARVLEATTAAA